VSLQVVVRIVVNHDAYSAGMLSIFGCLSEHAHPEPMQSSGVSGGVGRHVSQCVGGH
jgi:hypothetical protein